MSFTYEVLLFYCNVVIGIGTVLRFTAKNMVSTKHTASACSAPSKQYNIISQKPAT